MSQANTLIKRPLIRPRPVAYLGKNYFLYDNFADLIYTARKGVAANGFRYQDWTVGSGTWTAASGWLTKTAPGDEWEDIYIPSRQAYGTWEYIFKLVAASDVHGVLLYFISNETGWSASIDGYGVSIIGNNTLYISRVTNGVGTPIINPGWVADAGAHTIKVTRDAAGNFELFFDGASVGTALDNTYTTSLYMFLRLYNSVDYIDNLEVY